MATSNEKIEATGHGLYLKYLSLLGNATPIALKVVIKDIEAKQQKSLATIIKEKEDELRNNYHETYLALFEEEHRVNTRTDSWDISVFLDLLSVLLEDKEQKIIQCIREHRKDIERYTEPASISYKTLKEKWDSLLQSINELIDQREGQHKFKCKLLIHSYDESKINGSKIDVSRRIIETIKQTNVLNEHIDIATKNEDSRFLNEDSGPNTDDTANKIRNTAEIKVLPQQFIKRLEDTSVYTNEPAHFICELDSVPNTVEWRKHGKELTETDTLKYFTNEKTNVLHISSAKREDEGKYTCNCGNISTSAFLKVYEQDLVIVEHLHVVEKEIKEDQEITLTCKVNADAKTPKWFHNETNITSSSKVLALSQDREHKLIINKAKVQNSGLYMVAFDRACSNTSIVVKELPQQFIKRLEDTSVYTNEPASFICELDSVLNTVEWQKNGKELTETDELKYFTNGKTNLLHISRAKREDEGKYTCNCGNISTSAFLKVYEQDLVIVEHLHVVEKEIKEDQEITLTCKVNADAKTPKWFHNETNITSSSKVLALSQDREHKLIINRVKVQNSGLYMVAFDRSFSSTSIFVKDNYDLGLKHQLTKEDFENWVRGVLGMKYLKLGLENVSENAVKRHHDQILRSLRNIQHCNLCNEENLQPCHIKKQCDRKQNKHKCLCSTSSQQRRKCPTGEHCSRFYDLIVRGHRYEDPCLKNTKIERWSSDQWSVATCYINTPGYQGKTSAREVDCAGLLCLFINNTIYLPRVNFGVFDMARRIRNEILHAANYELSEGKLTEYLDQFIEVLEEVKKDSGAQVEKYIEELDKLKNHQIKINIADEQQKLKDHTMEDDADIIEKAREQKDKKLHDLEQRQRQVEQLQFLSQLRSLPIQHEPKPLFQKLFKAPKNIMSLDLKLCIMIYANGKNDESPKETLQRIHGFMSAEVEHHKMKTRVTQVDDCHSNTARAIRRLLQPIFITKDTLVNEVKNSETHACVSLKIGCSSLTSLEKLLVAFHGNEFRKCVQRLKKCLKEEKEGKTAYDVEASCSSKCINGIRKELYDRGIFEGITYDFRCEKHDGTQNTWYCSDHDTFCCSTCMEKEHRTCDGLRPIMSNNETQRRLCIKREIGAYRMDLSVKHICVLPKSEILLSDSFSDRLTKLNSSYKLVNNILLGHRFSDMCYIGNGKAVVLNQRKIVFVNVSGELSVEKRAQLDHSADYLACHGDILYTCDGKTVRVLKTDGTQERVLCNITCKGRVNYMAVSDDGEKIYYMYRDGIIVIDNKGNHLCTLNLNVTRTPSALCCTGDGSVLVLCQFGYSVVHIDYKGEKVIGKLDEVKLNKCVSAMCYDRRGSRLVVCFSPNGTQWEGEISVLELQYNELE